VRRSVFYLLSTIHDSSKESVALVLSPEYFVFCHKPTIKVKYNHKERNFIVLLFLPTIEIHFFSLLPRLLCSLPPLCWYAWLCVCVRFTTRTQELFFSLSSKYVSMCVCERGCCPHPPARWPLATTHTTQRSSYLLLLIIILFLLVPRFSLLV
jgi:hypothetical protein